MNQSNRLLVGIGVGLCLVIISFVIYYYTLDHSNSETTKSIAIPSNETQTSTNILHHYQVKVNELVNLGERTR